MLADLLTARMTALLPSPDTPYAFGLSGGKDSTALLYHLRDDPRLSAVYIVDHGLRDGSAADAAHAKKTAYNLGSEADVLTVSHPASRQSGGVQAWARKARYSAMGAACRAAGVRTLVTAHHADDQAETVLMRLDRGSGWRGAAGMAERQYGAVWPGLAGVTVLRPALKVSQQDLLDVPGSVRARFLNDPANQDPKHRRSWAREKLQADLSLRAEMLSLAEDMRHGVDAERARWASLGLENKLDEHGRLSVPPSISVALLARLAPLIGGQEKALSISGLREALHVNWDGKTIAIGAGCLATQQDDHILLTRDPVALTGRRDRGLAPTATPISITAEPRIWDGRFLVSGASGSLRPKRMKNHIGFQIEDGKAVQVESLIKQRLSALLAPS